MDVEAGFDVLAVEVVMIMGVVLMMGDDMLIAAAEGKVLLL